VNTLKTDLSLLSLFTNASFIVQIVMLILLFASIYSWTIILQRGKILKDTKNFLERFTKEFHYSADLHHLYDMIASKKESVFGIERVFKAGFREYVRLVKQDISPDIVLEAAERAMRIALVREEQSLECHLPFLATVGSISVYVGLFGTVWGIMTAFRALGTMQQATLAMVAPGISEALVATALGLFAAIPAVFAFNRFANSVQEILREYENVTEEFVGLLHRQLHVTLAQQHESNS